MTTQQPASLLTLQERVHLAGTEGSLTWLIQEMQLLAQADQPTHGVTPADWAVMADAADQWRESITDLLDHIAQHTGGGR